MITVKKGDRFTWNGVKIEVTRVSSSGDWADLRVSDPFGYTWPKRQALPLPATFEPVAS